MTRSRWRVFLTVFLVVFLGGFGVSGAAALWSVDTTAVARVPTGTWTSTPSPTPFPWTPLPSTFQATTLQKVGSKDVQVTFPADSRALVYVVESPGALKVTVDSSQRTATITYPDQGCYPLRVSAGTSLATQSAPVQMVLKFANGGGNIGTATIGERCS